MNNVCIIGRLGADPELRYTGSGRPVVNFRIAVNATKEITHWFRIVAWNGLAEVVAQYLNKGSRVGIVGRLSTRDWDDKDGNKRTTVEIIADRAEFLDPKTQTADSPASETKETEKDKAEVETEIEDNSIPF